MDGGLTKPVTARVRKGTGGRVIIRISRKIHLFFLFFLIGALTKFVSDKENQETGKRKL